MYIQKLFEFHIDAFKFLLFTKLTSRNTLSVSFCCSSTSCSAETAQAFLRSVEMIHFDNL